jgi:hypothetical protein
MAQTIILAPIQAASAVGEAVAQFVILGHRGFARAITRRFSTRGNTVLKKYEYFTGKSVRDTLFAPGNGIGDMIRTLIWAPLHWSRTCLRQNLLLGSMTAEEFSSGEIAVSRLVEIKLAAGAGRWYSWHGIIKVLIFLFIVGFTAISSGKHGPTLSGLGVLALAIAPLARLQVDIHEPENRSIFFSQHTGTFRAATALLAMALWGILYAYSQRTDFGTAVTHFLTASAIQGPVYAILKFILPGEILLIPLGMLGIGLAYFALL